MVGKKFTTNNSGEIEVLENEGSGRYLVRFLSTGTQVIASSYQIRQGSVKDRFYPSVAEVGFLGNANTTAHPSIYSRWKRMIQTCYDSLHLDYYSNGEKGVRVEERWHNYENYQKDLLTLWEENGKPERYRIIRTGPNFGPNSIMIIK